MRVVMYPGWEKKVSKASDPGMKRKGLRVFDWAVRTAPVDTGEYRDRIEIVPLPKGGYRIQALADHSIFVEFGTWKMAPYHTLAVSLSAAKG